MLTFARKLTLTPAEIGEQDLEPLRGHEFDDDAIADIVNVTAMFALYNRLAEGLGVDNEPDFPPRAAE